MLDAKKEPVFNASILNDLRIKKGLSCYKLSSLSGVPRKDIHCFINKSRKYPTFDTVARLAYALEVNTDVFINKMNL